jgi:hypothetical protein
MSSHLVEEEDISNQPNALLSFPVLLMFVKTMVMLKSFLLQRTCLPLSVFAILYYDEVHYSCVQLGDELCDVCCIEMV